MLAMAEVASPVAALSWAFSFSSLKSLLIPGWEGSGVNPIDLGKKSQDFHLVGFSMGPGPHRIHSMEDHCWAPAGTPDTFPPPNLW